MDTEEEIVEAQAAKLIFDKVEAKRMRELRKQEAIERSKTRQANPEYFAKIVEDNRPPAPKTEETVNSEKETAVAHDSPVMDSEYDENFDPFKRKLRW